MSTKCQKNTPARPNDNKKSEALRHDIACSCRSVSHIYNGALYLHAIRLFQTIFVVIVVLLSCRHPFSLGEQCGHYNRKQWDLSAEGKNFTIQNPNRSLGRKWHFLVLLVAFCFLRGTWCLFLAQNSPLLFAKTTSNTCSPKNRKTISPNDRIGLNKFWRSTYYGLYVVFHFMNHSGSLPKIDFSFSTSNLSLRS